MKRSERLDVVEQAAARTERERAERVGAAERHLAERPLRHKLRHRRTAQGLVGGNIGRPGDAAATR